MKKLDSILINNIISSYSNCNNIESVARNFSISTGTVKRILQSHNIPIVCIKPSVIEQSKTIINTEIDALTILKESYRTKYSIFYECKCKCGKIVTINIKEINCKRKRSCGCGFSVKKDRNKRWKGYGEISGSRLCQIRRDAATRGWNIEVTIEYLWNLFLQQNRKCALSGVELHFNLIRRSNFGNASLDRIDSSKGYIEGNLQWIHKDIQTIKWNLQENILIKWCYKILFLYLHKNRLDWEQYLILLCDLISTRSKDPNTHHGCIITDSNYRIISCGYNGSIQGIDDKLVPLTRPEKYAWMIHSEENALIFAKQDLKNCYAFITGQPCSGCMRKLIQSGIRKIFYGDRSSNMINQEDTDVINKMCKLSNIELIKVESIFS